MKILINAVSVKKKSGGMFQIAINYILKTLEYSKVTWYYFVSEDLDLAICDYFKNKRGEYYFVFPTQPDYRHSYFRVKKELRSLEDSLNLNVVYSICAPSYFTFKTPEVMRFTNPWVTHPNDYCKSRLTFKERIYTELYCMNQRRMMRRASFFVTQTETTKKGIIRITGVREENVKVVNNVLPAAIAQVDNRPIPDSTWINISAVGNALKHKNFDIIPEVLAELKKRGINNVRFHTTLPKGSILDNIVNKINYESLQEHFVNHGFLNQQQLGEMYRHCQYCFLPTLLEVFSASAVEALYFGLPIVASDFGFNSSVLGDSCLYYEPTNAVDAADKFVLLIKNEKLQIDLKNKMKGQFKKYSDYDAHFNEITDFLIKVGDGYIQS